MSSVHNEKIKILYLLTCNLQPIFKLGLIRVLELGGAIALTGCLSVAFSENPALAQIIPDATLGGESSVLTPNVNIRGLPGDRIDGGAVRGTNLFHSFQEFNIGEAQRVYFANPSGIDNILSRITGNNLSNILGTLGVDGAASLFLLNPNGIIFGAGAQLDISGSFFVSTANSVVFDNGYQFSAKNPETPALLTVNVPLGVQYGTNQPQSTITNIGNLAVGQNLTLDAGNLDLQGQLQAGNNLTLQAQDTVKIRDSLTHPFVAVAGGKLLIQGNQIVDIFALNHPNSGFYSGGDMLLRSGNTVGGDAHYWSGGNFRIEQLDGSLGDLDSPNDPIILTNGNVTLGNYRGASLHILAGGSVTLENVEIIGTDSPANTINPTNPNPFLASLATFQLSNGTEQTINGNIQPTLDIRAGIDWTKFPGDVPPFPTIFGDPIIPFPIFGGATSANIRVNRNIIVSQPNGLVLLTNQYQPNTALSGNIEVNVIRTDDAVSGFFGNSSSVIIDSRGNIELFGNSLIRTSSATGNAGNISLIANGSFLVRNGGLSTRTTGRGDAGDVLIQVGGAVSFADNSFILAFANSEALGDGGDINIQSGSLVLTNGSQLQTFVETGGQGEAGDVNINVRDTITIAGFSGIFTDVGSETIGNAGDITVQARTLDLRDGGQISTVSNSTGKAGDISIAITDSVNVSSGGSIITVSTQGNSGNLSISTGKLNVSDELTVLTTSSGGGNAGELSIIATDSVNVSNLGVISTATGPSSTGNSGTLSISTGRLNVNNGKIDTTSFGRGNAGDLSITATDLVNVSDGGFLTTGTEPTSIGNGGTLSISTRQLDVRDRGEITTYSLGTGNSGNISVVATDSVNVVNQSGITTSSSGTGLAGALDIETGKLSIRDGSLVFTSPLGAGAGGDLSVRATESIEVLNTSVLSTSTNGSGDAGNVIINTQNLLVDSNSKLSADTFNSGQSGDITINTTKLSVRNGGEVSTGVYLNSSGNGGKLTVNATDSVDLNGGSLATLTVGSGASGDLEVNTRRLTAQNGGRIEARTAGISPGGTVTVNASESIELIGNSGTGTNQSAAISAFSDNLSFGNAPSGNIILNAGELMIRDGADVTTETLGRGEGGDIRVQANSLSLSNNGKITTRSTGEVNAGNAGDINLNLQGDLRSNGGIISATSEQAGGGDINISADDIRLRGSSLISTSVFDSTGGGGNITINSTVFLAIEDSDILANAEAGPGGDITINSSAFIADLFSTGLAVPVGRNPGDLGQFRGNGRNDISVSAAFRGNDRVDISADSGSGSDGTVSYFYVDPTRRTAPLPDNLVDASDLIDRRCTSNSKAKESSFTITGRGGLPPNPNDPLTNQEIWVDWITLEPRESTHNNSAATHANSTDSHPQQLVEAQGWVINDQGQVILTAQAPTVAPNHSGLASPVCEQVE